MANILTVIPARIGSKRIPEKAIRKLNGEPLIRHIIKAALGAQSVGKIVVSTDSNKIIDVVKDMGVDIYRRSPKFATDTALLCEVSQDVLFAYNARAGGFDAVLSLQPTSPLLRSETIDSVIGRYEYNNGYGAVATVTKIRKAHPYLCKSLIYLGAVQALPEVINKIPQYPKAVEEYPMYYCNGAAFLRSNKLLYELDINTNALGHSFDVVITNEEEGWNIDTQLDFDIAEFLMKRRDK